ncbi:MULTISPECIES: APC family permease [unclassified Halorubrum]|uniref:APC family permease n=1 Tax=unclassified Halorubrum TaxID=2642239 RepID=UPI000B987FD6|nr:MULTISPECIES: APC family permease [unclassified Halorubrum]OYR40668.1 amino acid transporter [Halorubrum sp. Hd13]OYR47522.1 amino acid transporter [Halorubrum sp. Ea8]OYR48129.1 amino acid transporter [Halorubrum sp. Eb13]OYR52648.1 amino acid transporter [Halorubrum sp. Ea1]
MSEGDLKRDLGLYSAVTLSMGAMIGGGIFVLPAVGFKKAGPAVIVAYLLAGLIVLPNALSKAEMATAMPEDGGTYLYIDRAMGPLFGTVAGIGVWFSLVFKSAFALVGLGAYLLLLVNVPATLVKAVALGLGGVVILLNMFGTEKSGQVQGVLVSLVVLVLGAYVVGGVGLSNPVQYSPFVSHGLGGIATATAFVFVSYAGIGEVASVAEEISDPGRNIPRAMLISIGVMLAVYTAVVGVIVGVVPADTLVHGGPTGGTSLTPMADGAERVFGGAGVTVVAVTAVLALTSMANAGVLGTSRFLLAMSRDSLLPERIGRISPRFLTPVNAVLVTGGVLLTLIAFVPVVDLAKLASAFLILVFSLENVSVIVFREVGGDFYDPEFRSPGYPVVQVLGVIGGVLLIAQMGLISVVGAVGISAGSAVWYLAYARSRTDRTGALGTYFDREPDASEPLDEAAAVSKREEE